MILSAAWMLRWYGEKTGSSNYVTAGIAIDNAVINALSQGIHTPDLGGSYTTESFTLAIIKLI